MGTVYRSLRNIMWNPLRTGSIVTVLSVSIGVALMRCTH